MMLWWESCDDQISVRRSRCDNASVFQETLRGKEKGGRHIP